MPDANRIARIVNRNREMSQGDGARGGATWAGAGLSPAPPTAGGGVSLARIRPEVRFCPRTCPVLGLQVIQHSASPTARQPDFDPTRHHARSSASEVAPGSRISAHPWPVVPPISSLCPLRVFSAPGCYCEGRQFRLTLPTRFDKLPRRNR